VELPNLLYIIEANKLSPFIYQVKQNFHPLKPIKQLDDYVDIWNRKKILKNKNK